MPQRKKPRSRKKTKPKPQKQGQDPRANNKSAILEIKRRPFGCSLWKPHSFFKLGRIRPLAAGPRPLAHAKMRPLQSIGTKLPMRLVVKHRSGGGVFSKKRKKPSCKFHRRLFAFRGVTLHAERNAESCQPGMVG